MTSYAGILLGAALPGAAAAEAQDNSWSGTWRRDFDNQPFAITQNGNTLTATRTLANQPSPPGTIMWSVNCGGENCSGTARIWRRGASGLAFSEVPVTVTLQTDGQSLTITYPATVNNPVNVYTRS